jgi:monothiol glutaredoxin
MSEEGLDATTKEKLERLVSENKVLLFMKGNKLFPQCGFSNTACRILDAIGQEYETVNVLDDDRIRNGVKEFSNWPTIPQLYVNGDFLGGCDIMIEMYQSGELAEVIEVASAS